MNGSYPQLLLLLLRTTLPEDSGAVRMAAVFRHLCIIHLINGLHGFNLLQVVVMLNVTFGLNGHLRDFVIG